MKILIGIQARSGSERLPGKIFEEIGGKPILQWVIEACEKAPVFKALCQCDVKILCPKGDEKVIDWCKDHDVEVVEGPEQDVLTRYVQAADGYHGVIRVTGDCWAIPHGMISECIKAVLDVDYASNTIIRSFPEGWDVQGCSARALKWFDADQKEEREHPFRPFDENQIVRDTFLKNGFQFRHLLDTRNVIFRKTSIDTKQELERARDEYKRMG